MEAQKPGNSERGRRDSSVEKYLGSGQQQKKKSQAWTNKCNAKEREWKNVRYTCPFQQFCICGILLPMLWFYIFLLYIFFKYMWEKQIVFTLVRTTWRGWGREERKISLCSIWTVLTQHLPWCLVMESRGGGDGACHKVSTQFWQF